MVIFGGAGDLTKRLVVPSRCTILPVPILLPEGFAIVGFDMADVSEDAWKQTLSAKWWGSLSKPPIATLRSTRTNGSG